MTILLAALALALALPPALLFLVNLRRYRKPGLPAPGQAAAAVSVLIPARDEEASIEAALRSVLASEGVELEVVVLDDHSRDRTAEIVQRLQQIDARVRLELAPPLPPGANGKQHACWVLAQRARHPLLVFLDADVRLAPDALARMAAFVERSGASLVSGAPRQEMGSWLETLVVSLIPFTLLGFLPMGRMRRSRHPAYAAGVGQLFLARAADYFAAGGHGAILTSRHDGLALPRAFRRAGLATDLFDASDLAVCRMYHDAGEVIRGFAKNADEGLAKPGLILPASVLLLGGQVLPFALLAATPWLDPLALGLAAAGVAAAWLPRLLAHRRLRQPLAAPLAHPLGVAALLAIQWVAFVSLRVFGRRPAWKGRNEAPAGGGALAPSTPTP